ncbi:rRNA maturation RNase YbeY [Arachidicoccus soli]|uniref:Endoribonuclease YbeY n=1 Tax=Arachidicoccus soli TaxID=2341117 RepID=A0A386HT62_9BACT|nr:rRNA maturation RNase YbeY [Arachidicoccus soli]AYD49168.1 rRNA maturation RNase YbeY [Arachidicoccus soli]
MSKVFFHYTEQSFPLSNKKEIKQFIEILFQLEKKPLTRIDYIFCSDEYLLQINKQHLQHDYYTDIITFELSQDNHTQAEIYISVERVKENAYNLSTTFKNEILRVLFHGALHLCGYKDKSKKEEELMRKKEEEYLGMYNNDK